MCSQKRSLFGISILDLSKQPNLSAIVFAFLRFANRSADSPNWYDGKLLRFTRTTVALCLFTKVLAGNYSSMSLFGTGSQRLPPLSLFPGAVPGFPIRLSTQPFYIWYAPPACEVVRGSGAAAFRISAIQLQSGRWRNVGETVRLLRGIWSR